MSHKSIIEAIIYSNPDHYPPIINSVCLLARYGFQIDIRSRAYDGVIPRAPITYPPSVTVCRIVPRSEVGWQEYLSFIKQVVFTVDKSACIVIGHDMHGFLPAKLLAMRLRRPLIYHCHDYVERNAKVSFGGRMARAFEQRFARTADLVIVPDADRAKVMKQELRLAKEPVIAANAPLSSVPRCKAVMADALAKQGKSFERIVLRQGRIGEGHAIEVTLQSIKHWKNKNWGFVLLGPSEPAYLDKIIDMARSLGVEEQFAVLPPVRYDQVALYTAGADVGHGLYEPIHINNVHITTASNKLMEYIAAGLPMLVSENPSLRSFVETHQCGLIANETSPTSIAIAVNSLLSNEEEMNRMGLAGKKIFEEIYCYERQFAPILEQIYALARRAT